MRKSAVICSMCSTAWFPRFQAARRPRSRLRSRTCGRLAGERVDGDDPPGNFGISVLIDALTEKPKGSAARLRSYIDRRERVLFSSLVLYEWLRGPRLRPLPTVKRPRGREIDLAIAACALAHGAAFWTLNPADFRAFQT